MSSENMPIPHSEEGTLVDYWKKIIEVATEKRKAFKQKLESATSVEDIKKALQEFSVYDEDTGKRTVVNFFEGAMADKNEPDGLADLDELIRGIDDVVEKGVKDQLAMSEFVWNYATNEALERLVKKRG